ncbi:MAG: hypothetical protein IT285_05690 [Bdellovibrionales bacterium]|nr:hypothetical protein [Bdellovibrionales bacterium]
MKLRLTNVAFALALAASASGCLTPSGEDFVLRQGTTGGSSFGASAAESDGFQCPGAPNVLPNYDFNLDGTEFWEVCHHPEELPRIRISGATVNAPVVCVYPVEINDENGSISLKKDAATQTLIKKCVTASVSDGYYTKTYYDFYDKDLSFSGILYNAVFIVKQTNTAQMEVCLDGPLGANVNFCPPYSFGRFRN